MNLSKFSNESGQWVADGELINHFIDLSLKSKENFFGSEIDLLNPDIIIGMNFGAGRNALGLSEQQDYYGNNSDVRVCHLITQSGKEYPILTLGIFLLLANLQDATFLSFVGRVKGTINNLKHISKNFEPSLMATRSKERGRKGSDDANTLLFAPIE